MLARFVGGPFDGKEIDLALINRHATVAPITTDFESRQFVILPGNPSEWEQIVRGEDVASEVAFAYERVPTISGPLFVLAPTGLDQALNESKLRIHPRARTVLSSMSTEDRRAVVRASAELRSQAPADWPSDRVARITEDRPVYLLRATSEFRAFIRILDDGEIELFDVVREEILRLFLEHTEATR